MSALDTKSAREVIALILRRAKTKLPEGHDVALADSICNSLDRQGLVIADLADVLDPPDEMLRVLKSMRTRLLEVVKDKDTPARDLASNSRRLQDVSRDIYTIEERARADMKSAPNGGRTNGAARNPAGATTSGSLDI